MARQTKPDSGPADAMANALFSSFTQPAPPPAAAPSAAPFPAPPAPDQPPARSVDPGLDMVAPPARATNGVSATPVAGPSVGRAGPPRRNRAAPEAKRRRETVILSEAERRPIVQVAEHMAATKPGASFSEAARFLLAIGEQVLATRPDAYAQLERTPPAGWASLARSLAAAREL